MTKREERERERETNREAPLMKKSSKEKKRTKPLITYLQEIWKYGGEKNILNDT
jgi:hypothetical protein